MQLRSVSELETTLKAFSRQSNNPEVEALALYNLYMTGSVADKHAPHLSLIQEALRNEETAELTKTAILNQLATTHCSLEPTPETAAEILAMYAYKYCMGDTENGIHLTSLVDLAPDQQQAHLIGLCLSNKPYHLNLDFSIVDFRFTSMISFITLLNSKKLSFKSLSIYTSVPEYTFNLVNPSSLRLLHNSLLELDFSSIEKLDLTIILDSTWIEFIVNLVTLYPSKNKLTINIFDMINFLSKPELRKTFIAGIGNHTRMLRFQHHTHFNEWHDFFSELSTTSINGLAFHAPILRDADFFSHLAHSNINFLEISNLNFESFNDTIITQFFARLKFSNVKSLRFNQAFSLHEMTEAQLNAFCAGLKEAGIVELKLQDGRSTKGNRLPIAFKERISACIMHNIKENEKRHGTLKGLIMHSLWEQPPKLLEQIQDSAMDDVKEEVKNAVASFKAAVTF